jgi:hypothetical protein
MSDLTYSVMLIAGFVVLTIAMRIANRWLEHHRPGQSAHRSKRSRS